MLPDAAALHGEPGSPEAIRAAAQYLGEQLVLGSHTAEQYGSNVMLALDALGVAVPAGMAPMIAQAVAGGWSAEA
jgi:hypothetical protein